jgi:hypothetical protein
MSEAEAVSEEEVNNDELEAQDQEQEVPVETTQTSEQDVSNGESSYKGTEGSKWGKIVVAMENQTGFEIIDEGREDKGFKSQAQAVEAVKKHVNTALDNGIVEADRIPAFYVLRVVKTIMPKPVQTTVLDFGDE